MSTPQAVGALALTVLFLLVFYACVAWAMSRARRGKAKDCIQQDEEGWWWWDETWSHKYGPFKHREWAAASQCWYAAVYVHGDEYQTGDVFRFRQTPVEPWVKVRLAGQIDGGIPGMITLFLEEVHHPECEHHVTVNKSTYQYLMPYAAPFLQGHYPDDQ